MAAPKPSKEESAIVYWMPSGEKYHISRNCATLKLSLIHIFVVLEEPELRLYFVEDPDGYRVEVVELPAHP